LLLYAKSLDAGYASFQVLWDVSLSVESREFVCLLGPNGAGKSTTLKTIAGLLKPGKGEVFFKGEPITGLEGEKICWKGISYVSEELNLFTRMSVQENLSLGAYAVKDKKERRSRFDFVFDLFPVLRERSSQLAGSLSGGERKMLAIGRGMMSTPSLLLIDEPSLGLSPQLTSAVFNTLEILNRNGLTILLVEQNATKAIAITSKGYIMQKGKIVLEGRSSDLQNNEFVRRVYLGT
jgi:branched-chain amino acid transport system ATP-binding protein